MTVKNNSNNESAVETQCIASLPTDTQSTADLQIRIRELEKEIARLHGQIKEQRYGLTWLDVPEAFETESENKIPILEEVKEKAIDATGRDALNASANNTPPHIIIEGDNYHALTCLNYTHRGKIDVIYIDPPYNTGNDGFTYKDKRFLKEFPDGSPVPKEHPLRHSYWLSFMSKRLELAKNLLSDKGVIFISIDDNELKDLICIGDKVFDEENRVSILPRRTINSGKHDSTTITLSHDYILIYAKNVNKIEFVPKVKDSEQIKTLYKFEDEHIKERGRFYITQLNKNSLQYSDTMNYPITTPDGTEIWPGNGFDDKTWIWRWGKEKFRWGLENDFIVFKKPLKSNKYKVYTKSYEFVDKDGNLITRSNPNTSLDFCTNEYTNFNATPELERIMGERKTFDYPKPVILIHDILKIVSGKDLTILDFFAGSGTTLHATMKLNAEDGGHRQCILVQQREGDNNICENVTYERNRRVMCGYTNAKGEQVEGLGGRLKYYRTAFVGKHASHNAIDADRVELSRKAGYLLALGENTLEEIAHTDTYQIFADTRRDDVNIVSESNSLASCYTAIYFTENYAKMPEFVAEIDKLRSVGTCTPQINVYIFCWGTPEIFEGEFDDLRGISLKAIPQPILDVYKSINQ